MVGEATPVGDREQSDRRGPRGKVDKTTEEDLDPVPVHRSGPEFGDHRPDDNEQHGDIDERDLAPRPDCLLDAGATLAAAASRLFALPPIVDWTIPDTRKAPSPMRTKVSPQPKASEEITRPIPERRTRPDVDSEVGAAPLLEDGEDARGRRRAASGHGRVGESPEKATPEPSSHTDDVEDQKEISHDSDPNAGDRPRPDPT